MHFRKGQALAEETGSALLEYRQKTKSGDYRWISNHLIIIRDASGKPIYQDGNIRDITEQKRAEEALMQKDAIIEDFFEASPGILNIEDEEFRYIKTDKLTPTYFGLDRHTIVGRSVQDLVPGFITDNGIMMRRVLETGEPELNFEVSSPVPNRPGETAYFRAS